MFQHRVNQCKIWHLLAEKNVQKLRYFARVRNIALLQRHRSFSRRLSFFWWRGCNVNGLQVKRRMRIIRCRCSVNKVIWTHLHPIWYYHIFSTTWDVSAPYLSSIFISWKVMKLHFRHVTAFCPFTGNFLVIVATSNATFPNHFASHLNIHQFI